MQPTDVTVDRHLGIGGSDACRLVAGDWLGLYEEKAGIRPPVDLSDQFHVQLGKWTEPFHLNWLAERKGLRLHRDVPRLCHPEHRFMFGHLDALVLSDSAEEPIDTKHSHGAATLRENAQRYMPQLAHYALICGVKRAWISVIAGNSEPEFAPVDFTDDYLDSIVEMEKAFWWHVEMRVPPEEPPKGVVPSIMKASERVLIGGLRDYDWSQKNEFASLCTDYLLNKDAAATFEKAKKAMKEMVPADAATVKGMGLSINRAKNGNLLFKEVAA